MHTEQCPECYGTGKGSPAYPWSLSCHHDFACDLSAWAEREQAWQEAGSPYHPCARYDGKGTGDTQVVTQKT